MAADILLGEDFYRTRCISNGIVQNNMAYAAILSWADNEVSISNPSLGILLQAARNAVNMSRPHQRAGLRHELSWLIALPCGVERAWIAGIFRQYIKRSQIA